MDKKKLVEKIKHRVEEFRRKHKHEGSKAKNVSKPKKHQKEADASKLQQKHKKVVSVGPKGGKYVQTTDGHKDYQKALVKGSIEEIVKEEEFFQNFKKERQVSTEVKKAVTSADATTTAVIDAKSDAVLHGENKPAIQEATTPAKIEAEKKPEAASQAAAPVEAAPAAEPAAPPKKELSFDGLFAEEFSLGSTLRQNPNGGNVITGVRPSKMDYVASAQNKKNVKMSADDLKQIKQEPTGKKK